MLLTLRTTALEYEKNQLRDHPQMMSQSYGRMGVKNNKKLGNTSLLAVEGGKHVKNYMQSFLDYPYPQNCLLMNE